MYYAYILQSLVNGNLYKGSTENIEKRIEQHNSGLVAFTKKFMPWKLIHFESFETRSEAMAREKYFKTGAGRDWLKKKCFKIIT